MHIKEIILYSPDIKTLKFFYSEILELPVYYKSENKISLAAGNSLLTFIKGSKRKRPFYHFAFNVPSDKFKEAKEWITSSGISLISLNGEDEFDFKSWNAHSIYFYDPADNIVELISRHGLKKEDTEKYYGDLILNISEIGLPVLDVKTAIEKINNISGIPFYSGDDKSFAAMGDEHGLFIIVKEGRKWFPDCHNAKVFPLTVVIQSDNNNEIVFESESYRIIT